MTQKSKPNDSLAKAVAKQARKNISSKLLKEQKAHELSYQMSMHKALLRLEEVAKNSGSKWLGSAGAPALTEGRIGDFHLNATDGVVSRKVKGKGWLPVISLVGPEGKAIQGPPGKRGPEGKPGEDGEPGPKGKPGKSVELKATREYLQWRREGEAWQNLISLKDLRGQITVRPIIGGGGSGGGGGGSAAATTYDPAHAVSVTGGFFDGSETNVQVFTDKLVDGFVLIGGQLGTIAVQVADHESRIAALEAAPGGSSAWGAITGTLSDQTDLQTALDRKMELIGTISMGSLNINFYDGSSTTNIIGYVPTGPGEVLIVRTAGTADLGSGTPLTLAVGDFVIWDTLGTPAWKILRKNLPVDTDALLAANSDTVVASQKATKTYIDNAVTGLLEFKGSTNASANPNYPVGQKGDAYVITNAGKIGGASGKSVDVGDVYLAIADNAGGTEASVGTSWIVMEHNLQGALLSANNLSDLASAATARTNLGLGSIAVLAAPSGAVVGTTDTQTLTNKRVTPRVNTLTDAASVVIDIDAADESKLLTISQTTAFSLTGTPTPMQKHVFKFKSSVARTISWSAGFRNCTGTLPFSTIAGKWHYIGIIWNADDSVWDVMIAGVQQ